jgi:hypothetical protein
MTELDVKRTSEDKIAVDFLAGNVMSDSFHISHCSELFNKHPLISAEVLGDWQAD